MTQPNNEKWHTKKEFNFGTIIALVVQSVLVLGPGIWYMSALDKEVEGNKVAIIRNEKKLDDLGKEVKAAQSVASGQAVSIGRIEVGVNQMQQTLREISDDLRAARNGTIPSR